MPTPEPLHVAFVWHMHQPYYRSAPAGDFQMPWARLHALKDYLDMVDVLSGHPGLHQTFNLVPSLVEQLEIYAAGDYVDLYWQHTLKPAEELDDAERVFVVERMCEASAHPRAHSFPRYLELALKREAQASLGWEACARSFATGELRDLQVLFNLAWFDPSALEAEPLSGLVARGRGFSEEDKVTLAEVQADILARVIPAYREAAQSGQVELSTSPYFHPILPLLTNSDTARVGAAETILPRRRFAHPEDAWEQVESAVRMHEQVFGERPRGMWCSEQAVGEDVLPLLARAGLEWTISDETVLARSLSGSAGGAGVGGGRLGRSGAAETRSAVSPEALYQTYLLPRESGEVSIIFRDHALSDLIGFTYRSWGAKDAAADLLRRLCDIAATRDPRLVTIALDGENAWEYYHQDGRDFLAYLYEGLLREPALRCVTVSEHLREIPPVRSLNWLHTGSWIGGDLRTWSGDPAHNEAWDLLHDARDLVASRREGGECEDDVELAWHHVLVAEGSDWFWWFGMHHHSELDHVWDLEFRRHLQEAYRLVGEPVPPRLHLPILDQEDPLRPLAPRGPVEPTVDGRISESEGWESAGRLGREPESTMHHADVHLVREARFSWRPSRLFLLLVPYDPATLPGLAVELIVTLPDRQPALRLDLVLPHESVGEQGRSEVLVRHLQPESVLDCAWADVVELSVHISGTIPADGTGVGVELRVGYDTGTAQQFHTKGLASLGWSES